MLRETVALRPLLEQLVAQADFSSETRVELVPGPSVDLDVDRTALWRILSNLLGNAIRAAGPQGHVGVLIKATAPVTIEIADDGLGFDGQQVGGGSLGLSTVAHLTREYGAETVVRARYPRGTQVEIIFPAGGAEVEGRDG
jgi:signal transduction histidine kinase